MTMMAVFLVALGVFSRLLPALGLLPYHVTFLGAVCLYAGARLPRRWAFAVPLIAMLASDLILDAFHGGGSKPMTRLTVYGTFALLVALGRLPKPDAGPAIRAGLAILGSTLFFLTTNFAVWAADDTGMYPLTAEGLVGCYAAALPFFRNMLVADLVGTGILFGIDALARRSSVGATVDGEVAAGRAV